MQSKLCDLIFPSLQETWKNP